jgi:hypothetical protein
MAGSKEKTAAQRGKTKMTIYVITSRYTWGDTEHESIMEVTPRATDAEFYRAHFHVTEEPDASEQELERVAELNQWLYANYNAGAHWIVETAQDARHVVEMRRQTPGQYRAALQRQWETKDDYRDDICNA